jgi:predicted DNA-binding protein
MSLRFPTELRERVKRFAKRKGLEEATAVRLLCTERLEEIALEDEERLAEDWQDKEAIRAWERLLSGKTKIAPDDALEKVFAEARARARRAG